MNIKLIICKFKFNYYKQNKQKVSTNILSHLLLGQFVNSTIWNEY
jgi:hypothetical protein